MTASVSSFIPDNQNWTRPKFATIKSSLDCADYCREFFASYDKNSKLSEREAIEDFVISRGVKMPESKTGWLPERLRLESSQWWDRQLKKRNTRRDESNRIKQGKVTKYCSDELLEITQENKQKLTDWLDRSTLKNQDGEELSLKIVASKSTSNPKLRRNELMVRAKGVAAYYDMIGWVGMFCTVTNPPSWHRLTTITDDNGNKSQIFNTRYNGATPRESNQRLVKQLSLCRGFMSNHCLEMAGIRIAEPHKDGTTHWHLLLWFPDNEVFEQVKEAFTNYFLLYEGAPQKGVMEQGIKWVAMDTEKGDAVGYIAKYVSKNIDGAHMELSRDDDNQVVTTASDGAARVKAWAACWGIRQFQFLGGAPVGVYRELRRKRKTGRTLINTHLVTVPTYAEYKAAFNESLDTVPTLKEFEQIQKQVPVEMVSLWMAADAGDYFDYLNSYNDAPIKPKLLKHGFVDDLKLLIEIRGDMQSVTDLDIKKLASLNEYGEPKSMVYGVGMGDVKMVTRQFNGCFEAFWHIETAAKDVKQEKPTVRERIESYATVRGADGFDQEYWCDVVAFTSRSGGFAPTSDLWQ